MDYPTFHRYRRYERESAVPPPIAIATATATSITIISMYLVQFVGVDEMQVLHELKEALPVSILSLIL